MGHHRPHPAILLRAGTLGAILWAFILEPFCGHLSPQNMFTNVVQKWRRRPGFPTKDSSRGYHMLVLGGVGSSLEPFYGQLSPKWTRSLENRFCGITPRRALRDDTRLRPS